MYGIRVIAFSPDGKKLAIYDNDSITFWEIGTAKLLGERADYGIESLGFSPDGKMLAVQKKDSIDLLSVAPGLEQRNEKLPLWIKSQLKNIIVSSIGELIRIRVNEVGNTITMRDAQTNQLLATLVAFDEADWLVTTPDGFFDGTPTAWKKLLWRFNNDTFDYGAVELYFSDFFHPNLLRHMLEGKIPKPKPGEELEKKDRRQPLVKIASVNSQTREQMTATTTTSLAGRSAKVEIEVTDNQDTKKKQPEWAASSGARDLRLFRNGSLVKVWHDDVFDKTSGCETVSTNAGEPRRVRCTANITITAGDNELMAYAFNTSNVKSADDSLSFKGADALKRKGTIYVLAVGVNNYADPTYNLKYAVADVDEIASAVKVQQAKLTADVKTQQYERTEIISLTDADATRDNIQLALKKFSDGDRVTIPGTLSDKATVELTKIKPAKPEDAIIIYYAGHGTSRDERFYLLPHNYNGKPEETGVSDIDLNVLLEAVDAGKLVLVIDACQSGKALGEEDEGLAPMNSKGLAQLAYDKGMLILTAAQSQQAALEAVTLGGKTIKHGLLTYTLLQGFQDTKADKDNDGQLSGREWLDYATAQVPQLQLTAMKERRDANRGLPPAKRDAEIVFVNGDKNADPSKRKVQTPRVFYRREEDNNQLVLARR